MRNALFASYREQGVRRKTNCLLGPPPGPVLQSDDRNLPSLSGPRQAPKTAVEAG